MQVISRALQLHNKELSKKWSVRNKLDNQLLAVSTIFAYNAIPKYADAYEAGFGCGIVIEAPDGDVVSDDKALKLQELAGPFDHQLFFDHNAFFRVLDQERVYFMRELFLSPDGVIYANGALSREEYATYEREQSHKRAFGQVAQTRDGEKSLGETVAGNLSPAEPDAIKN